ncbi:RNA-binding protein pop5 [Sporothrix bragantina]|uniref:RNA-binding protein pop5 n=1 Tax=Sporothrix bragantina TaxID=671064 RepID=A0ABP0BX91_9PEZI
MVRVKERYLLVNILYPRDGTTLDKASDGKDGNKEIPEFVAIRQATQSDLTRQLLVRGIKAEAQALFGDCGAGAIERTLSVKYFSLPTSTFILRITREHLRYVWTALTFMRSVPVRNGRPCIFRVARVGGTIRKVEEEAIRQARTLILATKAYMAGNKTSAFELLTRSTKAKGKGSAMTRRKDFVADIVSDDDGEDDNGDEDFEDGNGDGNDDEMDDDGDAHLNGDED